MAELEVEIHGEGGAPDPLGKKVGILAAVLAVLLGIVTIASHRAHTEGVLLKTDANDKWSQYQSKRVKYHCLELGEDLLGVLGANSATAQTTIARYKSERAKYERDSETLQEKAQETVAESKKVEDRALRYDFGEGLLEIGLVLSSLYFIARRKLFPIVGLVSATVGLIIAISGLLV